MKARELIFVDWYCENCGRITAMVVTSYGTLTKKDTVEHGIEGKCLVCRKFTILEEKET